MKAAGFPSLAPDGWTILGRRLRPLSLGHAILLEALCSPFAAWVQPGSAKVTVYDVLVAVEICRRPWQAARRLVESRWFPWIMACRQIRWALWWWNDAVEELVLSEKAGQICEYVSYWNQGPPCNTQTDGRRAGAPHLRRLHTFAVAHLHMSEIGALEMPLADVLWHFCTYWEMHGPLQICNEVDRSLVAAAEAAAREMASARN